MICEKAVPCPTCKKSTGFTTHESEVFGTSYECKNCHNSHDTLPLCGGGIETKLDNKTGKVEYCECVKCKARYPKECVSQEIFSRFFDKK
jgi:hypothetical protein